MKHIAISFALLALAASAPALYAGNEIVLTTFDPGGADARVYHDSPERNFGEAGELVVKSFGHQAQGSRKAYLRFPLSELDHGVTLEGLELRLRLIQSFRDEPMVFNVYVLPASTEPDGQTLGLDWDEHEITWANAPGNLRSRGDIAHGHNEGRREDTAYLVGRFTIRDASPGDDVTWEPSPEALADLGTLIGDLLGRGDEQPGLSFILTRTSATPEANTAFATKEYVGPYAGDPPTVSLRVVQ